MRGSGKGKGEGKGGGVGRQKGREGGGRRAGDKEVNVDTTNRASLTGLSLRSRF